MRLASVASLNVAEEPLEMRRTQTMMAMQLTDIYPQHILDIDYYYCWVVSLVDARSAYDEEDVELEEYCRGGIDVAVAGGFDANYDNFVGAASSVAEANAVVFVVDSK